MDAMTTPRFSWPGIDPAAWLRQWQAGWPGAPENLAEPILPGWTFNINSNNSSAPDTEVDVVAKYSYGRQLGRISDALALLIEHHNGKTPKGKALADFLTMKRDIDQLKRDAAASRVERVAQDLLLLKAQDEARYVRLRDALREALK